MKAKRFFAAFLLLLAVILSAAPAAPANSALRRWHGSDASGAIVRSKECPIIVQDELLTFDIPDFPKEEYNNIKDFGRYQAKVTARYTFYNPTDETVTADIVFPFGATPSYSYYYNERTDTAYSMIDYEKYDITVNGEKVEKSLRHTFYMEGSRGIMDFFPSIRDGYAEDAFFDPQMTVTEYVYRVSGVKDGGSGMDYSNAAADFPLTGSERKIYIDRIAGYSDLKNGVARINFWVENDMEIRLYVMGEPLTTEPEWVFYDDTPDGRRRVAPGVMTKISQNRMDFEQFALMNRPSDSKVSKIDWYNAVVDYFTEFSDPDNTLIGPFDMLGAGFSEYIMPWYEYEITFAPHEQTVNAVEAPMYPTIDGSYTPSAYDYTYLLSPAKAWSQFGGLHIVINTPYHMIKSNLKGFEKTQTGYEAALYGLPNGELEFSLSESRMTLPSFTFPAMLLAAGAVGILLFAGLIVLTVILLDRYFKKNAGAPRNPPA